MTPRSGPGLRDRLTASLIIARSSPWEYRRSTARSLFSSACTSSCPAVRTPSRAAPTSSPRTWPRSSSTASGRACATRTATGSSSTAPACAPSPSGHGYEPVVEAVRAAIGGGVGFSRPTTMELDAAEDFVAHGHRRGDGEVHQERLGRHRGGGAAVAGRHRPRPHRRLRAAVLQRPGLVRRHPAARRGRARRGARAHPPLPLQRPRRPARAAGGAPDRLRDHGAGQQHRRARARLPRGRARAVRRVRHRARLRRDDHRFPLVRARRGAPVRRHARPVVLGQGHGQRLPGLGAWRASGS